MRSKDRHWLLAPAWRPTVASAPPRTRSAARRQGTIGFRQTFIERGPRRGPLYRLMEETAMNWLRNRLMWGAILVSLAGALAACEEGPAEDAGEVIDEQGEEATD